MLIALGLEVCLCGSLPAQTKVAGSTQPDAYTYRRVDGREMKAYVFEPSHSDYSRKPRAAICWCFTGELGPRFRHAMDV